MNKTINADFSAQIYDSILQIPQQQWLSLVEETDLAMNQNLIHILETTLNHQAQFWTLVIRDQQQLVACACLNIFHTDILQSAPLFLQKIAVFIRKKWPNFFKQKVLFCGLPVPSGQTHLRIAANIEPHKVLKLVVEQSEKLAKQQKAALLVFKEFSSQQLTKIGDLKEYGFYRGELQPIYQLNHDFFDFSHYQSALRSGYRRQMNASLSKFKDNNFKVQHIFDVEKMCLQMTPQLHQLYLNVWAKAKEKLECLPLEFFQELPRLLPKNTVLTLISYADQPVAFALGLLTENAYYNIYGGLDYSYNSQYDLYFNLFYQELDLAFSIKKPEICLGQTAGYFKSRLGAVAEERFFLMKPLSKIMQIIFKYFAKFIFPKIPKQPINTVFKESKIF